VHYLPVIYAALTHADVGGHAVKSSTYNILTPRLDVGIQQGIEELEPYIFNTTGLDVLELDLGI
jgi:hypothetical protein